MQKASISYKMEAFTNHVYFDLFHFSLVKVEILYIFERRSKNQFRTSKVGLEKELII